MIIDRPKAPPVCHGERMLYSEPMKRFVCHCGYGKPLTEYLAERSNYHLEDMTYQAKVEAVRSYIKGEPVPDWARETLAIESIRILKKAEQPREPHPFAGIDRSAADNECWAAPREREPLQGVELGGVTIRESPDWFARFAAEHGRRNAYDPRGCRYQSPGVGLPCGFCAMANMDAASHAYLQGFFRRHGSLSRNPMEPSDLDQRIAQATAEGKYREKLEDQIIEALNRVRE